MIKKGLLVVLSGPSGVGKYTLWSDLLKNKRLNLKYSISMTTRPKRFNELNGRDYFFVSHNEFRRAIKNRQMLEYATYCNNYYGTPKEYVEKLRNAGHNVLLEIEVQGGLNVTKIMKKAKDKRFVSIFILPPSTKELIQRLRTRGTEDKKIINARIKQAKWEISKAKHYKYQIVNDNLKTAKAKLKNVFLTEIKKNA